MDASFEVVGQSIGYEVELVRKDGEILQAFVDGITGKAFLLGETGELNAKLAPGQRSRGAD